MKKILLIILMAMPFLANAQVKAPGTAEGTPILLNRTGWTATSSSGQRPEGTGNLQGLLANLFDGDATTYWTSNYSDVSVNMYPHILTINMLSAQTYKGILLHPRNTAHGPNNVVVEKSDDGTNWTPVANIVVASKVIAQYIELGATHTSQYLKVTLTDNRNATETNAALFELGLYNTGINAPDPTAYSRIGWVATGNNTHGTGGTGDSGGYAATIDNDATTYWHTRYGTTATSEGIANPLPTNQNPIVLEYDMTQLLTINKLSFVNRPSNLGGRFTAFTIWHKVNTNDTWTQVPGTFSVANTANPAIIPIALGTIINARYIKLEITATQGNVNAMLAEFRAHYDNVLPVELTSFTAKSNGSSVGLKWTTATESNASHFDITRSVDGSKFASIGKVSVTGSGSTYNYTDFSPIKGNNYYQLVSVDNDGTSKTSSIEVAKIAANSNELTVTATAATSVKINIYAAKATTGTITASNITGQKIASQAVKLAEGNNAITVSTAAAKGLIILSLNTAEGTLSKKIIK